MSRRRWVAIVLAVLAVALFAGYAGASNLAYETGTTVSRELCQTTAPFRGMTPAAFETRTKPPGPLIDSTPYLMPDYAMVSFPSRDPGVTIAAWWVPAASAAAPAVVLVHGIGRCRWDPEVLLPAGMLHRHGFSVLLIDLRNHGDSTVTDGHQSAGIREQRDVLGAWDWLQARQGLPAGRIGLYGVSFGAAAAMVAMGEESQVAALWEDSGFSSIEAGLDDELTRLGLPTILGPGVIMAGRVLHGIDLASLSPVKAMAKLVGRPLMIVHGMADERVPVKHARVLVEAVRAGGGSADPWILPGVPHVRAAFVAPVEYERRLVAFFSAALGAP